MGAAQSITKSRCFNGCYTVDKFDYQWVVLNFPKLLTQGVSYCISSEALPLDVKSEKDTFKIVLYPNGYNERVQNFISVWLQKTSTKERLINFTCAIANTKGEEVCKKSIKQLLTIETFIGWPSFCRRNFFLDQEAEVLNDGSLTLNCSLEIFDVLTVANPEVDDLYLKMNGSLPELSKNLSQLLLEKDFCDISFIVDGKAFDVHKAVLSARSAVFKTMMKKRWHANSKGIKMEDITKESMEEMLIYIYSGKVNCLNVQAASRLFYAADKYDLRGLKAICSKILSANLDETNVVDILLLGERYSDEELREVCIEYMVRNALKVKEREEWLELLKNYPDMANVVFKRLISKSSST